MLTLATAAAVSLGLGCTSDPETPSPVAAFADVDSTLPLITYATYSFEEPGRATVFTVWADGFMVWANRIDDRAAVYSVVQLRPASMDRLTAFIRSAKALTVAMPGWAVPHTDMGRVEIRLDGKSVVNSWDEIINPVYGPDRFRDERFMAFVQEWNGLRVLLSSVYVDDGREGVWIAKRLVDDGRLLDHVGHGDDEEFFRCR
jgi:hypothetical protein